MSCLGLSMAIFSCAGQAPPGGGPPDTIPPSVIGTIPDTNAVRVETDKVELEFSEYVDRRSAEESIFISPYIRKVEYDWSGTTLTVEFGEELKKNTTYVVNVGTDVKDLRASNRMAAGFTLAFSTGDSIDRGSISGRVFDEKPEGVMIFAYSLTSHQADTLDPGIVSPDYIMQTGKDGLFTLSNIRIDTYRLFAIQDKFKNLLYDKQIDQYGVWISDVPLSREKIHASGVQFRLTVEDTARPFVSRAQALDRNSVQVRFSEPVDSLTIKPASFEISDTLGTNRMDIRIAYRVTQSPAIVQLRTEQQLKAGEMYRLIASGVRDTVGNIINSASSAVFFEGTDTPDTLAPQLSFVGLERDSIKGYPLNAPITLLFTEATNAPPLEKIITIKDQSGLMVHGTFQWNSPATLLWTPQKFFKSKQWYLVTVLMDSIVDLAGIRSKDSIMTRSFQTFDMSETGYLEGKIVEGTTDSTRKQIYVQARNLNGPTHQVGATKDGKFKFEELPEGRYDLSAFKDSRGDGKYHYGRVFPFVPSDAFVVYPDTVRVRARWGVEDIRIDFK